MNAEFLTATLKEDQGEGIGARLLEGFEQAFENIVTQDKPLAIVVDEIQGLLEEAHKVDAQAPVEIIWRAVVDRAVDWAVKTQTPENFQIVLNRLIEQNSSQANVIIGRAHDITDGFTENSLRGVVEDVRLHNRMRLDGEEGAGYEPFLNDPAVTQL